MDSLSADWRKSSYSGNGGQNCVEVAEDCGGEVLVRDTKDRGRGPVLKFTPDQWRSAIGGVRSGTILKHQ